MSDAGRMRVEVEGPDGGCIVRVDPVVVDEATAAALTAIVTDMITRAVAAGVADPVGALTALLGLQIADARAYQREALRRGVLAL